MSDANKALRSAAMEATWAEGTHPSQGKYLKYFSWR